MTGIPSLKEDIACQHLLTDTKCQTSSWLRKQSFRNKTGLFKWPQVFVVLCDGCVYYYRNETAKTPSGAFSLYGYNCVGRAPKIPVAEAPWAFNIVHTMPEYKTYLFSASSEVEMKDWMKAIKKELKYANSQNIRSAGDGQDGDGDGDDESQTYQEIETKIYDDPGTFKLPKDYKNRKTNDFTDDDDIYRFRAPVAPPVPPREDGRLKKGATMHAPRTNVHDLTYQLDKKLDFSKQEKKSSAESKGRQRGSPDGASLKVKTTEQSHQANVEDDDDDVDPEKYWAAIHYLSPEREKASEIIRMLGEEGVYLVRDSSTKGEKVLVVYAGGLARKFKIEWQNNQSYLNSNKSVRYPSLEELLHHYYEENLPGYSITLSAPYRMHPMFKESMLR